MTPAKKTVVCRRNGTGFGRDHRCAVRFTENLGLFEVPLVAFFDRESKGVSIVGIQLVSPPFLNGSAHWKMEPLIRIWKKPSDPLAHVYEVADGKQYCSAYGTWDISEYEFWKEFTSLQ